MRRVMLMLICCAVVVGTMSLTGCGNEKDTTTVKTMDEYREEAARQINEKNVDAELEKLTEEIESDIGSSD